MTPKASDPRGNLSSALQIHQSAVEGPEGAGWGQCNVVAVDGGSEPDPGTV